MEKWRLSILERMGLRQVHKPSLEEWVLLLLYLDGKKPVYGMETLHYIFFIYPYVDARFSTLLFAPYSPELEKSVLNLERERLIDRRAEFLNGRITTAFFLTNKGAERAKKTFFKFRESWLLLKGFIVRKGEDVVNELEALKKTYNGKSLLELLRLLASKVEAERESLFLNTEIKDQKTLDALLNYARTFLKEMKRRGGRSNWDEAQK